MFGASSRNSSRINQDGTRNVYCFVCGEFITKTLDQIGRAKCIRCDYSERGIPIPRDILLQYEQTKILYQDSPIAASMLPESVPGVDRKFSLRSFGTDFMKAMGFAQKPPAVDAAKSTTIAKQRKRGRLFETTNLGSMEAIDAQIQKEQQK